MKLPRVAIVGRPNVGKSTLFNRILGWRKSIVTDIAGTTRDRTQDVAEWDGENFLLIDTGGIVPDADSELEELITHQALIGVENADLVLFVVDGREGVLPTDEDIRDILLRYSKPYVVVVNKMEDKIKDENLAEFYILGEDVIGVSAEHGQNIGTLLDRVLELIKKCGLKGKEELEEELKIAIVGRVNVGKSTYLNAVVGYSRSVVSEVAGTTRDVVDEIIKTPYGIVRLLDTAGIRKKPKSSIEFYGIRRAQKAIYRADVVLFMLDATEGVVSQDLRIAGLIQEAAKPAVAVFNKWDLTDRDDATVNKLRDEFRSRCYFLSYLPLFFVSAKDRVRVFKPIAKAFEVYEKAKQRVRTADFNTFLQDIMFGFPMPSKGKRRLKVLYGTQVATLPPRFVIFVNHLDLVQQNLINYIEQRIREVWDFEGVPVLLSFRQRKR